MSRRVFPLLCNSLIGMLITLVVLLFVSPALILVAALVNAVA
jgi:hypothetical protein